MEISMDELTKLTPASQRVTVHITREMAFDFKKMTQITKSVLGKLGCDGCHSGRVIDWVIINDFVVNPKTLEPEEIAAGHGFQG
jgi:hypothetical protein